MLGNKERRIGLPKDHINFPLEIVNDWMEKKLIKWCDKFQEVIEDWDKCNEHPQPRMEIRRFEKLSGYKYAGPK